MNPSRARRIGIMGGTFDPIHFGHLVAAEEAYSALGLSEVIFVPTGMPPHKRGHGISDPEDRYTMTLLATLDNPHFALSRTEIDRNGSSHTVDTLRNLRERFPDSSAVEFYFITGMDAVLDLPTWKEPEEVARLAHLVAAGRLGYNPSGIELLPAAIRRAIVPLEIPLLAISSTEIRHRVRSGRSIRYLVPWQVEHYIFKRRLYAPSGGEISE